MHDGKLFVLVLRTARSVKEVLHIVGKLHAAPKVQNEVMILSLCPHFNRNVQIFTVIRQENCPFLADIFLFFDF